MTATRILVADDHPTFRRGLRALIDSLPDIELIGEAADGEAAVEQAAQSLPDVVVMDLNMPGLNGVEATRRIVAANPSIAVLVLTMLDEDESVFAAMRAGARGYVVKGADTDDLLRALESVARGDVVFGPAVASRVLSYLTRPACGRISIMRSSAVQPAGRRRGGSREATTPLGSGGADNRYAAQRVLQGASGDRLGRRPAGGVSRTATQYQRRHARMAVSSRGVAGRGLRRPRAPARSACWCQSHNHRTGENRSPGKIVVLKELMFPG